MSDNVQSMFYHKEVPWHKKGVKLDHLANSAEAIKVAGLEWEVEKRKIYYESYEKAEAGSKYVEIKDKFSVVRKDNNEALGIVGDVYEPLQNKHAFKFFDDVMGAADAFYETAGALGKGERVWLLAKLPNYIVVKGNDIVEKYLLLTNSHDGSASINVLLTPIRVVCQNTLNIALGGARNADIAKIRHCSTIKNKIEYVRETLGIISAKFSEFEQIAHKLSQKMVNHETVETMLRTVMFGHIPEEQKLKTRAYNIVGEVLDIFEHGKGNDMPETKHTAWTAFNAVAEYVDYNRSQGSATRDKSILFGAGAALKQRAFDYAVSLIK